MTEERKKEILNGILDLMQEYGSLSLDIDFPGDNYVIHVSVEDKGKDFEPQESEG